MEQVSFILAVIVLICYQQYVKFHLLNWLTEETNVVAMRQTHMQCMELFLWHIK